MFRPHTDALSSSAHEMPYDSSSDSSSGWESSARSSVNLPFLVRTVRQPDLANLAEILASSFHPQDGLMGWLYPLLRAGIYEDLRSRFYSKAPHQACLVAVRRFLADEDPQPLHPPLALALAGSDRLVGTIEIALRTPSFCQFRQSRYLYLSNLAVQPEYRRQGVGQQLLQSCERIALDWGFQDLYLHVLENNHQARQLYLKAGYRLQRIEANPLTWMLGRPRQLFLRKHLIQA